MGNYPSWNIMNIFLRSWSRHGFFLSSATFSRLENREIVLHNIQYSTWCVRFHSFLSMMQLNFLSAHTWTLITDAAVAAVRLSTSWERSSFIVSCICVMQRVQNSMNETHPISAILNQKMRLLNECNRFSAPQEDFAPKLNDLRRRVHWRQRNRLFRMSQPSSIGWTNTKPKQKTAITRFCCCCCQNVMRFSYFYMYMVNAIENTLWLHLFL